MEGNKYNFQKLTPINTVDIEIYREAIDFVFENDDLRNIALSGAYSAGKSSVLESYKAKNKNKKFLHISLAHFESANVVDDSTPTEIPADENANNDEEKINKNAPIIKESVLEGKILNQLIHQILPKRIPQTNFRIKHRVSLVKVFLTSILFSIISLAIIHTIFFNVWKEFVDGFMVVNWAIDLLLITTRNGFRLTIGFVCVLALIALIYNLIKIQINKGIIKKLGTDKVDIEIFKDSDDSYFDKYLNEVLYLFERSKADVIVFEDMDRYNENRIFKRLREVNTLINVQRRERAEGKYINRSIRNVEENKITKPIYQPLRFLYLLRDDIFVSKDRTKFFDYIVPVIPVMDGSNAHDQFIDLFKKSTILDLFDESFLSYFSLYIDDMRILKNIYNEFTVYYNRLKKDKPNISPDKMLAIIAYKNLFPRDFSETQIKNGFVSALFNKKQKDYFIDIKKAELEEQLKNTTDAIERAKREQLESFDEWKLIYDSKIAVIDKNFQDYLYNNNTKVKRQKKIDELESLSAKRKAAIQSRLDNDISTLEQNMLDIKTDIARVSNESLRDLITDDNIDKIFSVPVKNDIGKESYFKNVRGNDYFDLLKYLIRNGYIDETYNDYMTYFYPNSLSQGDKMFLLSISNQKPLDNDYSLDDCNKILKRINILSFDRPETLNFNFMFYLLETGNQNKIYLDGFFNQLKQTENFVFIQEVLTWTKDWQINDNRLILFINKINSSWNDFLQNILNKTDFLEICRDRLILLTLYHTLDAILKTVNINKCLTEFISSKEDFLKITEPNIPQLISRFKLLGVSFKQIDYDERYKPLFDAVYENNLYDISFDNISQMLTIIYGLKISDDFKHKNYSLIISDPQSPLAKYMVENLEEYVEEIIANCGDKIVDDDKVVLKIVNSNISPETKEAYLNKLEIIIEDITTVTDQSLWKQLINNALVQTSEKNVIEYYIYCENIISDELIRFINRDNYEYDYSSIREKYSNEIQSEFFMSVLKCTKLANTHYKEILKSLGRAYSKSGFTVENITNDKILILIEIKIIYMIVDSLIFIRENYPTAVLSYIKKNTAEYINILNYEIFVFDEMLTILGSDISETHKLEILKLKLTDESITVINKNYSDGIKAYILEQYFKASDLKSLLLSYPKEGVRTKAQIETKAIDKINTIYDNQYQIALELFQKLLKNSTLDMNIKTKLFASVVSILNEEQCKLFIPQLDLERDYLNIFEGKRPKIRIDYINERILKIFLNKGWITKFDYDDKEPEFYRVISKRVRSEDDPATPD